MLIEPRQVKLTTRTEIDVRRTIPHARLRTIGAWCFVDHFGPTPQTDGMVVAAHPHTGLQTVTWLIEGQIEHRDSIGSVQLIESGQLNLMTAGYGIAHSEVSLQTQSNLHAVQLWIALPEESRNTDPHFEHHADLPVIHHGPLRAKIMAGEFLGQRAETKIYSDLMGTELRLAPGESSTVRVNKNFEHGFLVVESQAQLNEHEVPLHHLQYFEPGLEELTITNTGDTELIALLLGGVPLGEKILMWWNFIGRTHEEIAQMREQWNNRESRFEEFEDSIGGWIPAPELPNIHLQAR